MNEKLSVLTHYNGARIRDAFFKMLLTMFIFALLLVIGLRYGLDGTAETLSSAVSMILIAPFIIFLVIVPAYVFNKDFYRKNRYYMVSIKSLYQFFLKEIYSIKNILVIVLGSTSLLILLSSFSGTIEFNFVISVISVYLLTPMIASVLFLLSTYFGSFKSLLQGFTYLCVYIFTMISVFLIGLQESIIVLIVLVILNVVTYFVTVKLTKRIERNMEV